MFDQIENTPIAVADQLPTVESEFVKLLRHHYGDGIVYLLNGGAKRLYALAVKEGYVSDDGYLTRKGRSLLARHRYP